MKDADSIWNAVNAAIANGDIDNYEGGNFVQLEQASQLEILPLRWLWPDWLALGKLQILAGTPGTGKTTIALSLAAAISNEGYFPCGARAPKGNVLIWTGEDDPADTVAPRLVASGADLTMVYFIRGTIVNGEERAFDPGRDIRLLVQQAKRIGNVRLLIIDPIVSVITGDGHKANDVRRGLQPLVDMAQELDCAILGITHFSKGSAGRDPLDRVLGSQAFGALARLVLVAAKYAQSEDGAPPGRFLARAKSNNGPDGDGFNYQVRLTVLKSHEGVTATYVEWQGPIQGTAWELLGAAEVNDSSGQDRTEINDAKSFLLSLLSDGPLPVKSIQADATGAGYSWRTIERAKRDCGVEARKSGLKGGWMWALPS